MKWQMDHKYRTVLLLHSLDSLCQILKEFRRESLDNFTPVKLQEIMLILLVDVKMI